MVAHTVLVATQETKVINQTANGLEGPRNFLSPQGLGC